ncbi:MAG: XdhC family protein [Alphaproteobacteria bacterium]
MATLAGFAVTVIDPRPIPEHFPEVPLLREWPEAALAALRPDRDTAVVTLAHDPRLDDPALAVALRSAAFYIGALGSRRAHEMRLTRLAALGFGAEDLARIHGPVGLPLGDHSPAAIAVSALAQIIQTLSSVRSSQ